MNQEVKAKWLEALRSGSYEQGDGALRRVDFDSDKITYCCLGVLCDLAVKEGVIDAPELDDTNRGIYLGHWDFPPEAVRAWADLPDYNPELVWPGHASDDEDSPSTGAAYQIGDLNDDYGVPFTVLADVIEGAL